MKLRSPMKGNATLDESYEWTGFPWILRWMWFRVRGLTGWCGRWPEGFDVDTSAHDAPCEKEF
jgi:hypothetical protein